MYSNNSYMDPRVLSPRIFRLIYCRYVKINSIPCEVDLKSNIKNKRTSNPNAIASNLK